MSILTLGTAQYVFRDLCSYGLDYAEYALTSGRLDNWFSPENEYAQSRRNVPGAVEFNMNMAIARAGQSISPPSFDRYPSMENPFTIFNEESIACDTAIVFLDKDGNILRESGDFIYFGYLPQDQWEAGMDSTSAYGWIDISDESDSRYSVFRTSYAGTKDLYDLDTIRITGYMDGSRIEPLSMAFLTSGMYYNALDAVCPEWDITNESEESETTVSEGGKTATVSVSSGTSATPPYSASELDAMGLLEWEVRFDHTAQADPTQELVTIYARWPEVTLYEPDGSVQYQTTEEQENLLDLLKTMGGYRDIGRDAFYSGASQFDLWNLIVFSSYGIYDLRDDDSTRGDPSPDAEYTIMTALQASPLKIAMTFLRNVYLITFALALIGFLCIRSRVRKGLIVPLQSINEGMAADWAHISALNEKAPRWREPYELWEHYCQTQDTLQNNKNEIARLNAALAYAKTAEERRRQMTSNIAHELKTPLAVIHSYAEGLKEHIAEEKRDRYIDVILSEAERTDSMVLELLDLSRLEAGKVKLSRDDFSLISLTRAIFEKLEMAAQTKKLQIAFSFPEDFTITADESRISQVVENFATNAIKYTPAGGHVWVKIQTGRSGTTFSIENDSAPLSNEALGKVWDTFYRVDEARSGGGTGLGLAIAKNIVELHGGKCTVRNTKTGVEFVFVL
jgi:signal transduction histidine kinase